ncbi:MAG: dTDP-glucose 4,6-dehydratase [Spirochaetia bacterium]|jgi:dTDP-glucose 4,6-dehydratase
MREFATILVTGGAGFIGSSFIRHLFDTVHFPGTVITLDALTYAGNRDNLSDIEERHGGKRFHFVEGDIRERAFVESVFRDWHPDAVAHFAAETHVDRSISGPEVFLQTNVTGTFNLLDAARKTWTDGRQRILHHVSTDEVFGSLGGSGSFTEETPYAPRSPYAATKAGSDHIALAWHHTFGLPVTLSNCSNNYGPFQFPEKLIPLMILNMLEGKPLPVYGDGLNIRDWLFVEDHAAAVWKIMTEGRAGERYNVGGRNERENLRLVREICTAVARVTGREVEDLLGLITFVKDRPGHDRRYAIDCTKIEQELGWKPAVSFAEGLELTVRWYLAHAAWVQNVRVRAYRGSPA